MIDKVKNTIKKYDLLAEGDKVVVGLSGGADSISLVDVLCSIADEYKITVSAVHVNHGIRGEEATRDENFVFEFCKSRNIPLKVFHKNIPDEAELSGESEEECGRRIRYECFSEVSEAGKIATAHTLSDSIETMIFNMLRGSSTAGLCSIPVKRDNIIRPLIDCSREEIEKYCFDNDLQFVTDSTNLKSDYTRNYIRRDIMPMFSKVNEAYITALARLKDFICEDNAYLESMADKLLSEAKINDSVSAEKLVTSEAAIAKRAIVKYIKDRCDIYPESRHINLIYGKLSEKFTLQLNSEFYICIKDGLLFIKTKCEEKRNIFDRKILVNGRNDFNGTVVNLKILSREDFLNNCINMLENAVDYDKINGDIYMRYRQEGDRIFLKKRKVTKSLKKLFCEMKIPKEKRSEIPVIADDTNVIWVSGIGVNGDFAIDKNTEKILLLEEV